MGLMCPACGAGWEPGHFCVETARLFAGGGEIRETRDRARPAPGSAAQTPDPAPSVEPYRVREARRRLQFKDAVLAESTGRARELFKQGFALDEQTVRAYDGTLGVDDPRFKPRPWRP